MDPIQKESPREGGWLESNLGFHLRIDTEVVVFVALLLLAVFTRFYDLESRVMSHDETTHVYFSWLLEQGRGYQHDPLSHGPLQFHLVALSYFLFGDTDATARVPAAVFGVLAVGLVWVFRRWLGKTGTWIAATLMVISPYMLYYSRYVRNEMLVVPAAILTVWAIFRYMENKQPRWLYLLSFSLTLHFSTKETAFIYTAQFLIFLGLFLAWRMWRMRWRQPKLRTSFIIGIGVSVVGMLVAMAAYFQERAAQTPEVSETAQVGSLPGLSGAVMLGVVVALVGFLLVAATIVSEFRNRLKTDFPALDLMLLMGTMTLPLLAALPANLLGWDPLAYQDPASINRTLLVIIGLIGLSAVIGLAWNWQRWLIAAGVFYTPFLILHTTLFTNGRGVATGFVGSLGYWIVQHGVERGSQPLYYYALLQIPIYEFLPALGVLIGLYFLIRRSLGKVMPPKPSPDHQAEESTGGFPVILFLAFWSITSLLAYTFAGERMPWLTVHIALPMILFAGWAIGKFIDSAEWGRLKEAKGWLVTLSVFVWILASVRALGYLLGASPPFQGDTISQLSVTTSFVASLIVAIFATYAVLTLSRGWTYVHLRNMAGVIVLGLLALVTVRAAFRAAFIHYDEATEFLVYAHSGSGPKTALKQIEDLSRRTTGQLDLEIAYDNETTYPFWWYLRNYRRALYFGQNPSRDLLNYPVILAGDLNWPKIDPLLEERYYHFEYTRIWWPMQDYYNLTLDRVWEMVSSAEYRSALWNIWLNRDYAKYGEITGKDFSLTNWSPAQKLRLYIRKDMAALIWDFGIEPVVFEPVEFVDPYSDLIVTLQADLQLDGLGTTAGAFSSPRDLAVNAEGNLYIADTMNHRIVQLSPSGMFLGEWGGFSGVEEGPKPEGTFNEPWGIALAPDGTVWVADTWNHRIQHFSSEGQFLGSIGTYGQAEAADTFWGPREIAVDALGRVYVADTGNKRIVVFDELGNPIGQFGGFGLTLGTLDEPVGLAVDEQGLVYVADTWNQRVQIFEEITPGVFDAVLEWPISGWYGQSLENKPYLAVSDFGLICVTDPEGFRVLCFDGEGNFQQGWGTFGSTDVQFGLPAGLTFDAEGRLWVADTANHRFLRFNLEGPALP